MSALAGSGPIAMGPRRDHRHEPHHLAAPSRMPNRGELRPLPLAVAPLVRAGHLHQVAPGMYRRAPRVAPNDLVPGASTSPPGRVWGQPRRSDGGGAWARPRAVMPTSAPGARHCPNNPALFPPNRKDTP